VRVRGPSFKCWRKVFRQGHHPLSSQSPHCFRPIVPGGVPTPALLFELVEALLGTLLNALEEALFLCAGIAAAGSALNKVRDPGLLVIRHLRMTSSWNFVAPQFEQILILYRRKVLSAMRA
jgi:hypothetical protein